MNPPAFNLRRWIVATGLLVAILLAPSPARAQNQMAEVQVQIAEGRRHFDALEYEQAVPALDRAIAILSLRPTDDTRGLLADAYEMRARARFGLGDQNGARDDFVALLKLDPGHALNDQISSRVVAVFEAARQATVTTVRLAVTPANAEIMLDGARAADSASLPVVLGSHTLTASRTGYRSATATFDAIAGPENAVTLSLVRTSAVFSIVTSPADVDVLIDGVAKGKTAAGPPPADYNERAARAGVQMSSLSAVMVVPDVPLGEHRVQFRRGCFVTAERRIDVAQLEDMVLDPVKLDPAVAVIVAQSTQPSTTVFVDGENRGAAPYTAELCEGDHTVELRSAVGRLVRRVNARAGQRVEVTGALTPAFALVSAGAAGALGTDLRQVIERALEPVRSVLIFAPPAAALDETLKASQLPPDWLSFDINKRPLGVTAEINAPMRRELSAKIAQAFDAQGVASVSVPSPVNRNRVVISLLGAGSGEPDVIELSLDRPESITDAISQLNRPVMFERPSLGFSTIDVADMPGAVVAVVDPDGPAARASLQAGDIVLKVDGQAVNDTGALVTMLASHAANDDLALDLKDRTGADKKATVKVFMTPRLIGMYDQTLLANRILADLRTRVLAPASPVEESIIRLNIAAALTRLQAWSEARTELQRVKLPEGRAVGNGTVQYLLGLCDENLGDRAAAEAAWRVAASSDSLLTEDGPSVRELAEARLAELQRRPAER